jgi:putative ABC transport system ATP-binding protein
LQNDPAIVRCDDLVRTYRTPTGEVQALRGVSAEFPRGMVTAVVGPSGSGKSSLLRLIAGMDRPTTGTLAVDGMHLSGASARARRHLRRHRLGYVFQRPSDNFVGHLTVADHMRLAAGRSRSGAELSEVLDRLGIGHRADHLAEGLSGGEQQRAAFAQALATGAPLVVADEPTAELDGASADGVLRRIEDLADLGVSFILATHDPAVIAASDHRVELEHGRLRGASHAEGDGAGSEAPPELPWPASDEPFWGDGHEIVRVAGVSKTYGEGAEAVDALTDVLLQAREGEIVALVGRSGSGKTTLLHTIAGWESPDEGTIEVPGGRTKDWAHIAVVPQRLGLMDELSVEENVGYPARVAGELPARLDLVDGLLRRFGLHDLRRRYPRETSLGEQQRTALARALIVRPRLLIADEPTGHQDAGWTSRIFDTLREATALGTCCIVATHDEGLTRYADRILPMSDGRIAG